MECHSAHARTHVSLRRTAPMRTFCENYAIFASDATTSNQAF